MTDMPNAILQMAYNKLYIPLLMLTTPALSSIHRNDYLKFHKFPFGNSLGKQTLNESTFPTQDTLMETMFLQAYRNWLMVINVISTPNVGVRWYEHHSRMLRNEKFKAFFDAWWDMVKQLCTQFITCPFMIDHYSPTYIQLLERARMDFLFAHAEKAQNTFEDQQATHYGTHLNHGDNSSSSSHRYTPYNKDGNRGKVSDSFQDMKKPILCLH